MLSSKILERTFSRFPRVIDDISKLGASVVTMSRKDNLLHHASSEDIMLMLDLMNPKYYMPVIGEYRHMVANANAASHLIEGDSIILVGRFQSRKYRKKIDFYEQEKTAYEVSILDYEMNDEKNNCKKYTKDETKKGG